MVSCRVSAALLVRATLSHSCYLGSVCVFQEACDDRGGVWKDAAEARALDIRRLRLERRESWVGLVYAAQNAAYAPPVLLCPRGSPQ